MTQPPPWDPNQPPPQVIYVQQPSTNVSGGIWSFLFQFWYVVAGIFAFIALCCGGYLFLTLAAGKLAGH